VPSAVDRVDDFQQRHPVIGVPLAVVYKFLDDQGPYLSAIITYYGFIAIFPLLLLASSILGFLLQGDQEFQEQVLNSALSQFPIIGDELGRPEGLQGSRTAVVVGALTALYGSLGLGQALQNAMNVVWAVPRNSRPNPVLLRFKSLLLLITAGIAVLAISVVSALGSGTEIVEASALVRWLIRVLTVVLIGLVLTFLFRLAAARSLRWSQAAPGAFAVAVMWQALQSLGTVYVSRVLAETEGTINGTYALVLGLIGIIFIAAFMGVLGMEINVVLARRLWPRALLTIFTDNVRLTAADKRAYAYYAQMQRHKGYERVEVTFEDQGDAPPPEPLRSPPTTSIEAMPQAPVDRRTPRD